MAPTYNVSTNQPFNFINLSTNSTMNAEAIALVQNCLNKKDPYLDLGRLGLRDEDFAEGTELDGLLRQCTHLETLVLSNRWWGWDDKREWMRHTSRNNGQPNQLNTHPPVLIYLTGLVTLMMAGEYDNKWGIADMGFVAGLKALRQLYLQHNQISEIRGLEGLSSLQVLGLDSNRISEIGGLDGLSSLQELYLSDNRISEIRGLEGLSSLQQLDLDNNQISEIRGLERLSSLQRLDLDNNQISEIRGLENLSLLQRLDICYNRISEISDLSNLSSLQKLYLHSNQISKIRGLGGLSSLQRLHLYNNYISEIRDLEFIKIRDIFELRINDNPLTERYQLKLSVNENHFPFIKDFLLRQEATNKVAVKYPIKVLLLGNHRSGKSSLVDWLTEQKSAGSTHILRIANYSIDKAKAISGQLPDAVLYDFGGQDFYHGLYRAFISTGGLQLLLFDTKKNWNGPDTDDEGHDIVNFNRHYWLGQKNHTGNTDPYIMVQTHADLPDATEAPSIDYENYPGYKKSFFLSLNNQLTGDQKEEEAFYAAGKKYCKTYLNGELKKQLQQQGYEEPQWYIDFLAYIFNRADGKHTSTALDEVLKHYKDERPVDERKEALKRSLTLLHRHGLVLYYDSDGLQNDVWLNPEALVQHIQQEVLKKDLLKERKGVVPKKVFDSNILNDKKIRTLLLKQKVIYLHRPTGDDNDSEYIIPNYLPLATEADPDYQLFVFGLQQPDFTLKFNDFIPFGFINQLICFYGQQPDAKRFWRNQLLFTLNKEARVLIKLEFETLQVNVNIQLLSNATVKKDKVATYLFYSLLALYWDKTELDILLNYKDYIGDKTWVELRTENDTASSSKQHRIRMFGDENTDELPIRQALSNKYDSWEALQHNEANIPPDLYLSVDGHRFINYKYLFNLQDDYTINAYLMGSNGRIDITTGKEVPAIPFAPFTHNHIKAMQKIFISYSKHDEEYKEEFRKHLVTLKEQKLISSFNCKEIDLGADWDETIQREIDECDIMVCLVSVDFLNTEYIRKYEVEKAMEKGKQLVPILIKPCDWEASNIGKLFAPNRGKNISLDQELFLRGIVKETTAIERAAWWVAIVKEMREKLFR
jgi:internalin A